MSSEMRPMSSDRRSQTRRRTNVETLWASITGPSFKSPVRIRDISPTGARLEVDHPIEPGEQVRIQLLRDIKARLIYVHRTLEGKWVAGCKFEDELTEKELKVLARQ